MTLAQKPMPQKGWLWDVSCTLGVVGSNADSYMLKKLRDRKFCQKIRKLNENKEFLEYNFPKLTQKEIEFLVLCLVKKKKKLNL